MPSGIYKVKTKIDEKRELIMSRLRPGEVMPLRYSKRHNKIYERDKRKVHRELGWCSNCKNYAEPGLTKCSKHLFMQAESRRRHKERRQDNNQCFRCKNKLPENPSGLHCEACKEKRRIYEVKYRARKRLAGECYSCKSTAIKNNLCANHYMITLHKSRAASLKKKQEREANTCQ